MTSPGPRNDGRFVGDAEISVITPCHNAREFLSETVRSVAEQAGPSLEHILVDDGSTDGSGDLVDDFATRLPHVRSLRLPRNAGASAARNAGADIASGRYWMFLDADDLLTPGTLAGMASALDRTDADLAICRWDRLRETSAGWVVEEAEVDMPPEDPVAALRSWIAGHAWTPPCCILWRREAFTAAGGWDERMSLNDDGHLVMRALTQGAGITIVGTGRGQYRSHGTTRLSLSQSFLLEEKLRSEVAVIDDIRERLARQSRVSAFAQALSTAYHRAALSGFKAGHVPLARHCEALGRSVGGGQIVSPTAIGRLLERVLGMQRKEAAVQILARMGFAALRRRDLVALRRSLGLSQ